MRLLRSGNEIQRENRIGLGAENVISRMRDLCANIMVLRNTKENYYNFILY